MELTQWWIWNSYARKFTLKQCHGDLKRAMFQKLDWDVTSSLGSDILIRCTSKQVMEHVSVLQTGHRRKMVAEHLRFCFKNYIKLTKYFENRFVSLNSTKSRHLLLKKDCVLWQYVFHRSCLLGLPVARSYGSRSKQEPGCPVATLCAYAHQTWELGP